MKSMRPIIINARSMRQNQTEAEKIFWNEVRGKKFYGHKFRRQHVFGGYIVDFVSIKLRLIIEIDGDHHGSKELYDAERTDYLNSLGYEVMRFSNNTVIHNTQLVLKKIGNYIEQVLTPAPPNL